MIANDLEFLKIVEILSEKLGIDKSDIKKDSLLNDLGIDDLDRFEILLELEDQFDIQIKDEDFEEVKNIQGILYLIKKNKI